MPITSLIKHTRACSLALLLVLVCTGAANAQSADEVVDKCLAAMGGREALSKITSRKSTGTVTLSTPDGSVNGTIEVLLKAPNKSRTTIVVDVSALGGPSSMSVEQRFDGAKGVTLSPLQGDTEIVGTQLENMRNNTFPTPLLNYKAAGAKIDLLPASKIDGRDVVVLQVTPRTGPGVRLWLDAQTSLLARTMVALNLPQFGDVEQTTDLTEYRTVDGIKVPFQIVSRNAAQTLSILFDKVEHNVTLDDAMFSKPSK